MCLHAPAGTSSMSLPSYQIDCSTTVSQVTRVVERQATGDHDDPGVGPARLAEQVPLAATDQWRMPLAGSLTISSEGAGTFSPKIA